MVQSVEIKLVKSHLVLFNKVNVNVIKIFLLSAELMEKLLWINVLLIVKIFKFKKKECVKVQLKIWIKKLKVLLIKILIILIIYKYTCFYLLVLI